LIVAGHAASLKHLVTHMVVASDCSLCLVLLVTGLVGYESLYLIGWKVVAWKEAGVLAILL
jgi:hypothetical protein